MKAYAKTWKKPIIQMSSFSYPKLSVISCGFMRKGVKFHTFLMLGIIMLWRGRIQRDTSTSTESYCAPLNR